MRITNHAKERIRERNITIQEMTTTLTYGKRLVNRNDPTKTTIIDNTVGVYMVTDKAETVLITVFRKA